MRRKVEDIRIDDAPSLDTLARRMEAAGGFSAKSVAQGVDLLVRIMKDEEMTTFLSFPADIVATGTRGVLFELIRSGYIDAVVTTCGTLDRRRGAIGTVRTFTVNGPSTTPSFTEKGSIVLGTWSSPSGTMVTSLNGQCNDCSADFGGAVCVASPPANSRGPWGKS